MGVLNGSLQLFDPPERPGLRLPIGHFFRSLAKGQGERAVGIILSGAGSDGTLGIKAIKGELGMVMVQQAASAKYDGMPRSALATGQWDIPRLRELLEVIIPTDSVFENFDVEHDFPVIGHKRVLLNGRRIVQSDIGTQMILLAIEEASEQER